MRRSGASGVAALIGLSTIVTAGGLHTKPAAAEATGQDLYLFHCGACHGEALEGQPDWRRRLPSGRVPAPPHDASGHTWHHPDTVLFRIVKEGVAAAVGGNYESDMPGFEGVLSDEEIRAVLAYIKSTWPNRERAFQDEVSRAAQGD